MTSLVERIDNYINSHCWDARLTDEENMLKFINIYYPNADYILIRAAVKSILEDKINNGEYECFNMVEI